MVGSGVCGGCGVSATGCKKFFVGILDLVVGLKIILDWVVGLFFGCGFYATFEIYLLAWFLLGILD